MRYLTPLGVMLLSVPSRLHHRRPSSQGQIISLNLPLILASCEISDTSGGNAAICSLTAASQKAEFSRSDNFSQLTIDLGQL